MNGDEESGIMRKNHLPASIMILVMVGLVCAFFYLTGCSSSDHDHTDNQNQGSTQLMSFSTADFNYYSGGEQIELAVFTERIAISVPDEKLDQLTAWLQSDPLVLQPPEIEELGRKNLVLVSLIEGATDEQIIELIARLNASGLVEYATPVFGTEEEMTIITDAFVVRFLDTYSADEIEAYIASEGATIVERDFLWPKCYRLSFTSAGGANVLEMAGTFYESGMVVFAHSDFITFTEPLWYTIAEEDFEGEFPKAGWSVYDQNPADGEYYWGKLPKAEFPLDLHSLGPEIAQDRLDMSSGEVIGWCSAGHGAGLPDRDPGDNCPETYAPNMDAWLTVGPLDLSATYWAHMVYAAKFASMFGYGAKLELLFSTNGQDWLTSESRNYYSKSGGYLCLDNLDGIGDLTGQESLWIALRFINDGAAEDLRDCAAGMFIDDIVIRASNLALSAPITNDPLSALQWGLYNTGQSGGDPGWDINIQPAWEYLEDVLGGLDFEDQDSILVAVLDEGVDLNHEDLNLVAGLDATYDPDDPEVVDSYGGSNPWDGHGTASAGIIGAKANDVGIVGVAPGVKIMPVRIAYHLANSSKWTCVDSDTARGIVWAAENGARVLSNSWGGGYEHEVVHEAISTVTDMGCAVICASGNYGINSMVRYPAKYEETIAVGAMSPCGERKKCDWSGSDLYISCDLEGWASCYGPEVDVVAPGVKICTTDITGTDGYFAGDAYGHSGNYFKSFNGTSSATPHVAGIAALMLTVNPDLSPDNIKEILRATARDLGDPGFDEETGHGLVDAYAAVTAARQYGDLSVSQLSAPSPAVAGQAVPTTCRVANSAPSALGPLAVRVYLSTDNQINDQDAVVGETTTTVNAGSSDLDIDLLIPADTVSGSYMLIVSVDDEDEVPELNETNNTFIASLQVIDSACLVVKPASVNFGTVVTGGGNQVNVELKNEGEETLATLVISDIIFSGDAIFNNTAYNLIPGTPVELGTNESSLLALYFMPETVGPYSGIITITSNDPNAPTTQIPLTGVATEAVTHTIAAAAGSGGSISPQGEVAVLDGWNSTFTITPDPCRYISDVLVDGLSVGACTGYTFDNVTQDHTFRASFGLLSYAIMASALTGGSISPSGLVPVSCGGSRTFNITPNEPYCIADVLVDGASVGTPASYTFSSVGSTHTIQAVFAKDTYNLTIIPSGTGTGTTTPSAGIHEYDYGTAVALGASPSASSTFDGWSGDVDISGNTVTMDSDKSVTATFTLRTYTITATAGENGTIDPSGETEVAYGNNQVYTFAPAKGYEIDTVTVDGSETTVTGDSYTFTNVTADHTTNVTFKVLEEKTAWSRTYGHADWNCEYHTYGLDVTDDGGYIFAADGSYNSAGAYDFWVVRIDAQGDVVWETGFGGSSEDHPHVVRQTSDDGFIVAGESYSYHTGSRYCDIWVVKLTSAGAIEWQTTYGGTGYDLAYDLKETFDGSGNPTGFLVAGYTTSFGAGGRDIWLVKLSTSGTVEQEIALGGSGDEYGRAVALIPDGGCIVVADTQSFSVVGRDIWVIKLDSAWNVEWEKTFGGSGDEFPVSVVSADDGGFVVGAYTDSFGAGGNDFWILKLDADGSLLWEYTYGGTGTDTAQDLEKTDDGGYIMTGWTLSFDVDSYDAWVVKLDNEGSIEWQKTYNVIYDNGDYIWSGSEWAYKVAQAADGGYVVAGDSDALDERNGDVWIFKIGSNGALGCDMETDTSAFEDNAAFVTVTDTIGLSAMKTTNADVNATGCSDYNATPNVSTQCEILIP
jgi:hypothetical protein